MNVIFLLCPLTDRLKNAFVDSGADLVFAADAQIEELRRVGIRTEKIQPLSKDYKKEYQLIDKVVARTLGSVKRFDVVLGETLARSLRLSGVRAEVKLFFDALLSQDNYFQEKENDVDQMIIFSNYLSFSDVVQYDEKITEVVSFLNSSYLAYMPRFYRTKRKLNRAYRKLKYYIFYFFRVLKNLILKLIR